jgi:hypothetical protein
MDTGHWHVGFAILTIALHEPLHDDLGLALVEASIALQLDLVDPFESERGQINELECCVLV